MGERLRLRKRLVAVRGTRTIRKRDLVHNDALPVMEVDPQTYEVRADGQLLTCEPAAVLPLAQSIFCSEARTMMLRVQRGRSRVAPTDEAERASLTLTFDQRRKSRLRARARRRPRGRRCMLPRGTILRDGDHLRGEDGVVVRGARGAREPVGRARPTTRTC